MDAFSKMLKLIREEGSVFNPPTILIGDVVSTSPLVIRIDELEIDKDNILINKDLVLANGDEVAILPTDDRQTFIVICKVVGV
jgi:Protein of unknown function (DUF2577)